MSWYTVAWIDRRGSIGKPPAGWTWTDEIGQTYRCDRDTSILDSAPCYACRRTSTP